MIEGRVLIAIMLGAVAAGCFTAEAELPLTPLSAQLDTFGGVYTFPELLALAGDGNATTMPWTLDEAPIGIEQMVPGSGGEPNIGVTSSGALFVTSNDKTMRSRDFGVTWETVYDFATPQYPKVIDQFSTADPMLWVDPLTDRIYTNHMHPGLFCTYMTWSDDEGDTWFERPYACGTIPGIDHQKVMTAPPSASVPIPMPVYPNVVYICNNKRFDNLGVDLLSMGTSCMMSYDGGYTYPVETQAFVTDELCSNVNGHPAGYPDGTVVFIMGSLGNKCKRPMTAVLSEDNGLTWTTRQCLPDFGQEEIDADITITPDGTAYVLFRDDKDHVVHLARTTDKFQTCKQWRIAPPDVTLTAFAGITSGDDGRIAMSWLGTRTEQEPGAEPSNATAGSIWHAFVTTSFDADSPNPTFVTQQVTPEEDPVQVGCIWLGGGGGGANVCRNLLDFIDMVADKDGRWYVAITDGCVPRNGCAGTPEQSDAQSRDRQVAVLMQDRGLSLYAERGVLPALGLVPPMPLER